MAYNNDDPDPDLAQLEKDLSGGSVSTFTLRGAPPCALSRPTVQS